MSIDLSRLGNGSRRSPVQMNKSFTNYKTEQPDTLDELGSALLNHQALTLLHKKLRSMPNYANRDIHLCTVEKRIRLASVQIEILANRLILLG